MAIYCRMNSVSGYIFVEGLADINFWDNLLKNHGYRIYFASNNKTRGKTVLTKYIDKTSKYAIFAMDSDHDFLCPESSEKSKLISNCKYVVQTLVYSKESILNHQSVIDDYLKKIKIGDFSVDFSASKYIEDYSLVIYGAFCLFLFSKEKKIRSINDKSFNKAIIPDLPIFDCDFNLTNNPFEKINIKLLKIIETLKKSIIDAGYEINDIDVFIETLKEKGFNEKTAAYFINGHKFENSIINPLIKSIKVKFKNVYANKLKKEAHGDISTFKRNNSELTDYIDTNFSFNTFVNFTKINEISSFTSEISNNFSRCIN